MKGNEAEYIIPLRKETMKVAKYDRAKKAVIATRAFLKKHTKSENVLLGKELNKKLQERGRKNVTPRVHVKVIKDEDKYKAELIGFPIELEKDKKEKKSKKEAKKEVPETKKEVPETKKEKTEEALKADEPKKELEISAPEKIHTKEQEEKSRHQEIITKTQTPKHEKKK